MKRYGMIALLVFGVLLSLSAVRVYAHEADAGKCCKSANMSDEGKQMKELFSAMKEKQDLLDQELGKDKLDMKKINQINDELKKIVGQKFDYELQSVLAAQKTMTPEQFKEFVAKRHEHMCCPLGNGKGMGKHGMFMHREHGMMGGMMGGHASSMVATPDGGVIVMKGHKLSKYDKNLSLIKEVKTEKIEAAAKEGDEEVAEAQGEGEGAPQE